MSRYSEVGELGDIKMKKKQDAQEQYDATKEKGADTDKEIPCFLVNAVLIVRMTHMPQRFAVTVGFKQDYFRNFMTKDQRKKSVTQLMHRTTEPAKTI